MSSQEPPADEAGLSPGQAHHVVIVGAGFAGLSLARTLGGTPLRVTVIDRRNYHLFQPLLYQIATAALSPGEIAQPIRRITVRLPQPRQSGGGRPQRGGGALGQLQAQGLHRLARLGDRPRLSAGRLPQPLSGDHALALDLSHLPAWRTADHGGCHPDATD
jgi:choline dehydrogenase-like flavoprotein